MFIFIFVQPYLPDFDSSKQPKPRDPPKEDLPKMVVVGGADTHHGGGPSHNLVDESVPVSEVTFTSSAKPSGSGGLWDDITEELGLPSTGELKRTFRSLFG
jgi:hypothetical protein